MNILKAKRIRHFLRLSYPVRVTAGGDDFRGDYPDLPGSEVVGSELTALYQRLESRRREWITTHVLEGGNVPMPNSHLLPDDQSVTRDELPLDITTENTPTDP